MTDYQAYAKASACEARTDENPRAASHVKRPSNE